MVNNAGIQNSDWIIDMGADDWERVIRANLTAPFLMTQGFLPLMRKHRYGRIVNIGSEASLIGAERSAAYVSAKAGLMGLTMTCAKEMAMWARKDPGDYVCNLVHPGFNQSEMAEKRDPDYLEMLLKLIPLGRPADSRNEIGAVVAFLCSGAASYITGAKFSAGGGLAMSLSS